MRPKNCKQLSQPPSSRLSKWQVSGFTAFSYHINYVLAKSESNFGKRKEAQKIMKVWVGPVTDGKWVMLKVFFPPSPKDMSLTTESNPKTATRTRLEKDAGKKWKQTFHLEFETWPWQPAPIPMWNEKKKLLGVERTIYQQVPMGPADFVDVTRFVYPDFFHV